MNKRAFLFIGAIMATIVSCQGINPSPAPATAIPTAPVIGSGPSKFTGTFMADARPEELDYLSLTQSGNVVSGYLLQVKVNWSGPDESESVKGEPIPVQGTVDGDAITLNFTNYGFTIGSATGRKMNDTIILTFPSESGVIRTLTFIPASQNTFNQTVAAFRQDIWKRLTEYRQATQEARATQEWIAEDRERTENKIRDLAQQLSDSISAIKNSTEWINDYLADLKGILADEQSVIQDLQADLEEEKQEANVRPMTCYQANSVVDYTYNSIMSYHYDSRLPYHRDRFADKLEKLESELSKVETNIATTQRIAQALEQAMKSSPYPLPDLTECRWFTCYSTPGDEKGPIADYQAAADAARKELPLLKAADADILKTADGIMAEGKAVLEAAQALVNCP